MFHDRTRSERLRNWLGCLLVAFAFAAAYCLSKVGGNPTNDKLALAVGVSFGVGTLLVAAFLWLTERRVRRERSRR